MIIECASKEYFSVIVVVDGGDRRNCGEDPDLPREGSLSSLNTHLLQFFLGITVKVSDG